MSIFSYRTEPVDDQRLAQSLMRSDRVTLPAQFRIGSFSGQQTSVQPLAEFRRHVELATISVPYNYQNAVWSIPYSGKVDGRNVPSFAASLAGRTDRNSGLFRVDYSIDPRTIPTISAADVLAGGLDPLSVAGKDVVVGVTSPQLKDVYYIPGFGRMGSVYVHLLGAETLKSGTPISLGWIGPLLLALAAAAFGISRPGLARQNLCLTGGAALLLIVPALLEARLLFVDITPGLFALLSVAVGLAWRRHRRRGLVNPVSGLPNLNALRNDREGRDRPLVAARIQNFAEIVSTLPPERERLFVEQIVARLALGSPGRKLYQGDEGIFAWFAERNSPLGHHLEALHSLFHHPVKLGQLQLDVALTFGVEVGDGRSLANRLGSALVAADEAAAEGSKWKLFDPAKLENVQWKLSLLSQLDQAIENGEVWVAYQPKLELSSRRICGAEALARWTHPEKGPISPMEFITAAEQHDRIEKLTYFVLDQAIAAAVPINSGGIKFDIAVNLSARLLANLRFPARVTELLAHHGLDPSRLTLELTETAAIADSGSELHTLLDLVNRGVKVSIDDYGTGLSTLEYLKRIPASEIKIDQGFITAIRDNRSDRLMVHSTIALAHSLGRTVVAEGAEDDATIELLAEMNCDFVQGFAVGRPTNLRSLARLLLAQRRAVA